MYAGGKRSPVTSGPLVRKQQRPPPGEWEGAGGYGYEWQRCNSLGEECVNVERFWEERYTPTAVDVGHTLRVIVYAWNSAGYTSATSGPAAVVTALVAPINLSAPTITGSAQDGRTLTAAPGSWEGTVPISYAYQWQRCSASGSECSDIEGATGTLPPVGGYSR